MTAIRYLLAALVFAAVQPVAASAEESAQLTIRNQAFEPSELVVKAGEKIKLTITNAQEKAAEFESHQLKREKVIQPGGSVVINIGPLKAGNYDFFDDFHTATKGRIVAK